MTQPAARTRLYNYTEYATANPGAPYNAAQHDAEANADIATINQLCTNIGLIQRDDGQLKNQSVHQDAFSTAALALIASDFTPRSLWLTATAYVVGDMVQQSTSSYVCSIAHTSGTFNTDLAAGRWIILGATAASAASSISNTPAGNIAATDVQAAINELDTEKAALAGSSAQVFSVGSATSANHAPRASQVQNNSLFFAVAAGTADAMTATISTGAITALVDGFEVSIRAFGANTLTNPTLNLTLGSTATGALTIVNGLTGTALVAGDIYGATHEMRLRYRAAGTVWALMNPTGASPSNIGTSGHVLTSQGPGARPLYLPLSTAICAAVRQTVSGGPTDSNGLPNLSGSTGSTSVSTSNISSTAPLAVAAAYGFDGASGRALDYFGFSTTNISWTGLSTNGTMYLYVEVNTTTGALTTGSTTLAPTYQWGGTYSTTNNQHTYNIQDGQMQVGNGSTASQVARVFVGQVTVSGGVVTAITWYAYSGRYQSPFTSTLPSGSTNTTLNHNLGVYPGTAEVELECTSAEYGFAVGDRLKTHHTNNGASVPVAFSYTATSMTFTTGNTSAWVTTNRSTYSNQALTLANWRYRATAYRGW